MSAIVMLSLKDENLLTFNDLRNDPTRQANLRSFYGIAHAPCGAQMRAVVDQLRPAFAGTHQELQNRTCWKATAI